jgi:hypothetical protein
MAAARVYQCDTWEQFERFLNSYFDLSVPRRGEWIFRGQSPVNLPLQPTIDRDRKFADESERQGLLDRLLNEFKKQAIGLEFPFGIPEQPREWELLARHHGLPSAVLDWTFSPYVAAYFAYVTPSTSDVAVWAFDRKYFVDQPATSRKDDPVEIWDDPRNLRVNPRALEQASAFMRVQRHAEDLEQAVGSHLRKFVLSGAIRQTVLRRLGSMGLTARRMFRDLDHAAASARWYVEEV